MKKTEEKTQKTRLYARTFASKFWVLWLQPIGIVKHYFGGLVPYEQASLVSMFLSLSPTPLPKTVAQGAEEPAIYSKEKCPVSDKFLLLENIFILHLSAKIR